MSRVRALGELVALQRLREQRSLAEVAAARRESDLRDAEARRLDAAAEAAADAVDRLFGGGPLCPDRLQLAGLQLIAAESLQVSARTALQAARREEGGARTAWSQARHTSRHLAAVHALARRKAADKADDARQATILSLRAALMKEPSQ